MSKKFDLVQALTDRVDELEKLNLRLTNSLDFFMDKWQHRKNYMKHYMAKARADGRAAKWRSKNEDQRI